MSTADIAHKYLLKKILEEGVSNRGQEVRASWEDGTPAYTISIFGEMIRYDLSEEFPALTLRETNMLLCADEVLWIWQKKSNNVHDLSSKIWDHWADKSGSIGKAYGYQMGLKHKYKEGISDQVDHILYLLKNSPADKRMITNLYIPDDLDEMRLEPCVYGCNFNVMDGKLNMIINQRSADIIVAGGWNVAQYAILQHMLAQVSNLEVGTLVHMLGDVHVYERLIPIAEELLSRTPYPAPKFTLNPDIKNFYDFRPEDIRFENYQTHPQINHIPVAV